MRVEIIAAVIAAAAVLIAAIMSRRSSREANDIDRFEANLAALEKRIDSLETELTAVKAAYIEEQQAHGRQRGLFRVAMRHIRDVHTWYAAWAEGDREGDNEPPPVPEPLAEWL